MELICKHFSELTASELYEIYRLRVSVFVVEQNCAYQDVDEADRTAWHIWLQDEGGIAAYARVLAPGTVFPDVSIGRVTAARWRTTTKAPSGRRTSPPTMPGCCPRISAAASSPRTRCLTCWATPTSYTGSSRASRGRPVRAPNSSSAPS